MSRILFIIANSKTPLPFHDIQKKLGEIQCDPSTIFRVLTKFKTAGLVKEVHLNEGFSRYEFIHAEESHHHHHVRCRSCGDIRKIKACTIAPFEKAIRSMGFHKLEHTLEFTGLCSKCA